MEAGGGGVGDATGGSSTTPFNVLRERGGSAGSEGAAGVFTAGARSGKGDDGSGGRRRGWRREAGGVGDALAKGGSSSTPFTVLRERERGWFGRGGVDREGDIGAWSDRPWAIGPGGRGWTGSG